VVASGGSTPPRGDAYGLLAPFSACTNSTQLPDGKVLIVQLLADACGLCGGDNTSCATTASSSSTSSSSSSSTVVGCDGVMGSGLIEDRCGICGGLDIGCHWSHCHEMTTSGYYQACMVIFCVIGTFVLLGWWYLQLNVVIECAEQGRSMCCNGWICGADYWIMTTIIVVFGSYPPCAGAIMAIFSLMCRSGMFDDDITAAAAVVQAAADNNTAMPPRTTTGGGGPFAVAVVGWFSTISEQTVLDTLLTVSLISAGIFLMQLLAFFGFLAYKRCGDESMKDPEDFRIFCSTPASTLASTLGLPL
jgi:hypothetical protein